ncbi:hypothetical protein BDD12DRAFT_809030 [Trichophaea hybrida]|nr:hypothetical protein BDD12DRAFT_809030 [Trichophaea hybrida]
MTRRRRTSLSPPPSSTRGRRRFINDEDLDEDLSTIADNYNDCRDDNSASDDEPLRRPSRKAMGKRPSNDSFTSTLGKRVAATQSTSTSAQPLHPDRREIYLVLEEEDERELAMLASKKVFD